MPLKIVKTDLVSISADAIVYAETKQPFTLFHFNPLILHEKGKELVKSRERIGQISNGDAKIVPASMLDTQYIIHTSAPAWHGGLYHELAHLHSCYDKVFQLALEHECKSIALPIIATDGLGYPKPLSQKTAFECIHNFLLEHNMDIYLVVPKIFGIQLPGNQYSLVDKFLDKNYIERKETETPDISNPSCPVSAEKFSEILHNWIVKKEMDEAELSRRANLSAKQFEEILDSKTYIPEKNTVAALGIALKLTLDEMNDFMKCAGYELTCYNKFDLIIEYCILNNILDVLTINMILFRFDQELLGDSNF